MRRLITFFGGALIVAGCSTASKIQTLRNELAHLKRRLEARLAEVDKKMETIGKVARFVNLERRYAAKAVQLQKELEESVHTKIAELEASIKGLEERVEALGNSWEREAAKAKDKMRKALEEKIRQLQKKLAALDRQFTELCATVERGRKEVEELLKRKETVDKLAKQIVQKYSDLVRREDVLFWLLQDRPGFKALKFTA